MATVWYGRPRKQGSAARSRCLIVIGIVARTIGFFWYNASDIDFYLQDGNTLHISSGQLALEPTVRDQFGATPEEHRRKLWVGSLVRMLLKPWKAHAPTTQPEPPSFDPENVAGCECVWPPTNCGC